MCAGFPPLRYTFCFRDYVNFEETMAIMVQRWGIQRLLLRARKCGQLRVNIKNDKAGDCALTEWFAVAGVVPMRIDWYGELRTVPLDESNVDNSDSESAARTAAAIHWTRTSMRFGSSKRRWFGKTVDRPPLAEKLSKDPWVAYVLPDDQSGDIVVFHRLGSGKLVYATPECMNIAMS
jgi:hypothetical protein